MSIFLRFMSDQLLQWSDEFEKRLFAGSARAPSAIARRSAANDEGPSWLSNRAVQALRPSRLPLCRWSRAWPEALLVRQYCRATASDGLRTERRDWGGQRIPRQLQSGARRPERDLRDQRRTAAPTRGTGLNGSGGRRPRLHQGGRHSRRYDRMFSYSRRPAVRYGGKR